MKDNPTSVKLPMKSDGSEYNILDINAEQKKIAALVIDTLIKWMAKSRDYRPLRLTVCAGAGRGKSYMIHQLTTIIKKIFQRDDVVLTAAYTGAAAFNIGGKTCHSSFGINSMFPDQEMTMNMKQKLLHELRYIVAIFIDERSMLPADIIGAAEKNVSMTCHGGGKQHLDWGGVPIVILWGDDYQLPPIDKGAFYCLDTTSQPSRRNKSQLSGMLQFSSFAKCVLTMTKHQRTQDEAFIEIQDRIRVGTPTDNDVAAILSLNFNSLSTTTRNRILNNPSTMHLFATRRACHDFNIMSLQDEHNEENPVAIIKSKLPKHFDDKQDGLPKITVLCRGARVAIKGQNFCPKIGLFNGAIGKVIEIIYMHGESPNTGHFPQYVLVEFPSYVGKPFFDEQPKWVPIPTLTITKTQKKQTFTYVPLELSYARTIHKFQGYQAGPLCDIQHIICDAGPIKLESLFPGLLYTSLSRATTIGSSTDRSTSAIFFLNLTKDRITNLKGNDRTRYKLIDIREKWAQHLFANITAIDDDKLDDILQQSKTINYTTEQLDHVITE